MTTDTTTAIFGSHVLTREGGVQKVLRDHWVVLEGATIAAISPSRPAAADRVFDQPGRFVLPGLMNLHNHCFSEAVARSHTEDGVGLKAGGSIVYTVLMPLSRRGIDILSAEERMAVARLGVLQLIKGGCATAMEPFRSGISEMFDAAEEMGLRFYGAPYLFSTSDAKADANGGVQYRASGQANDDGVADLRSWNALHAKWNGRAQGRIRVAMSPHATDTCGPDLLRAAVAKARELETPFTIHMSQSKGEVATIASRYDGRTPAEYLDWVGAMGPDLLAAHCIHTTDADLALMAERQATVVNCPRVFARSGTTASFGRFASHGVRTLVGTDGYNMDLLGELNAAAMISKLTAERPDIATAPELIDAVTAQAAAAIKRPDLGEIRVGAAADLTVVDLSHPHLQPMGDPRRALISLANRANVDMVVVDGRVLLQSGCLAEGDEAAITQAGAAAIGRIWDLPEAKAALFG